MSTDTKDQVVPAAQKDGAAQSQPYWCRPKFVSRSLEHAWEVDVALPGAKRESLEVIVDQGILEIRARRDEDLPEFWRLLRRERTDADYHLKLRLPDTADPNSVVAQLEDGLLRLRLEAAVEARPRTIEVR